MIIRSQGKTRIVNMNGIDTICIRSTEDENTVAVDAFNRDSFTRMGEYSTEEKAIKVLDMIAYQYASYSCRYGSDCSGYAVFQMPPDSEV